MIEPTIGCIVWVWKSAEQKQPYAGIIVFVENNTRINVTTFPGCLTEYMTLYQDEGEKPPFPYASWMPYQEKQWKLPKALEKDKPIGDASGSYMGTGSAY